MKISVIVPVYNTAQFLSRCIDSILSQSFADFELLLIDDGSTDGSGQICDAYAEKDDRIRVFHKENGGVSSARNLGLDNARGEWVTFVDSDDFIEDDYLHIEDGSDLVIRNWKYLNGDVKEFLEPQYADSDRIRGFFQQFIHLEALRVVWAGFYKKSVINRNNIRFDNHFRVGEDTLFAMRYYQYSHSIKVMGGACYRYSFYSLEDWERRYHLSLPEIVKYLDAFMDEYEQLQIISPKLTAFMFGFFYKMVDDNEKEIRRKWALSKPVLRYKKMRLPYEGMKFRLKYYILKVLSFCSYI